MFSFPTLVFGQQLLHILDIWNSRCPIETGHWDLFSKTVSQSAVATALFRD